MQQWIINPETLLYERVDEPRWKRVLRIVGAVAGVVAVVLSFFWLYIGVFGWDLPKTASLKKVNSQWQSRMELMNRQLDFYEQTLMGLEERDDDVYRAIYGLSVVPAELKMSGFGGVQRYDYLDEGGASTSLKRTARRLDMLSKRVCVQSTALDEVHQVASQAGDMLSCVPSVPPICPDLRQVHLSSPFGRRSDPVYGGGEFHQGQDFATKRGYPVYATGEGVVEYAECKFRGYGNEILIDHGYGYKTRYAHLNTIEVNAGMKVKRGERIGSVGNSGKSTGCHLHYEVIYRGNRVNPMDYMDITMPVSEFYSMIRTRADESPYDKRRSTTELLRRRRNGND